MGSGNDIDNDDDVDGDCDGCGVSLKYIVKSFYHIQFPFIYECSHNCHDEHWIQQPEPLETHIKISSIKQTKGVNEAVWRP